MKRLSCLPRAVRLPELRHVPETKYLLGANAIGRCCYASGDLGINPLREVPALARLQIAAAVHHQDVRWCSAIADLQITAIATLLCTPTACNPAAALQPGKLTIAACRAHLYRSAVLHSLQDIEIEPADVLRSRGPPAQAHSTSVPALSFEAGGADSTGVS